MYREIIRSGFILYIRKTETSIVLGSDVLLLIDPAFEL